MLVEDEFAERIRQRKAKYSLAHLLSPVCDCSHHCPHPG